ncbi:hypothetical protein KM043_003130 [Ampulex compressa]|nr:hypothetical protein KM043_003130 [Ampulex compressa]
MPILSLVNVPSEKIARPCAPQAGISNNVPAVDLFWADFAEPNVKVQRAKSGEDISVSVSESSDRVVHLECRELVELTQETVLPILLRDAGCDGYDALNL